MQSEADKINWVTYPGSGKRQALGTSRHGSPSARRRVCRQAVRLLLVIVAALMWGATSPAARAQDGFEVGNIVGLQEGTCIREGPGFRFRAHTRVPENEWAVKVIGGPRSANDLTWYDTSRAAAGDPSGGTGWVDASQSDMCPDGPEPGRPDDEARPTPIPLPGGSDILRRIRDWWNGLQGQMKWVWSLIILLALVYAWKRLQLSIFTILRIVIMGGLFWWVLDQTRQVWGSTWVGVVGADGPDLAIIVALLPAVSWLVSRVMRR